MPVLSTTAPLPSAPVTPVQSQASILARHPLLSYVVIAFAGAWLTVLPLVLSRTGLGIWPIMLPSFPFLLLGPLVGPTLAAFLVTNAREGRAGMRQLWRQYALWRVGIHWYLLIFFGPLFVLTLGACAFFGPAPLENLIRHWPIIFTTYLPAVVLGAILGGPIGEEPGWRGFALPRLQKRFGPVVGSLVLGAIWGCWHLVGFFGGWLGAFSLPAFAGTIATGMVFSLIVTWIYNNTRGSILIAILLHGASNAATSLGGVVLPKTMPAWVHLLVFSGAIGLLSYGVCAVLLIALTHGRLSYQLVRAAAAHPTRPAQG